MSAFVILIGSEEKVGQTSPTVLGPFIDHGTAERYLDSPQIASWEKSEGLSFGGWPTALVVSDQTCDDPISWMNEWAEIMALDEEGDGFSAEGYVAGLQAGDRAHIPERP